jgi:CubicO group peptidase (beta-lactamase class C family)
MFVSPVLQENRTTGPSGPADVTLSICFCPLQKVVDDGQLAGAATLVWRSGTVQTACVGWRDREANLPVERDTIFRLASATKPITSLAALMLVEQGRIALTDPISR